MEKALKCMSINLMEKKLNETQPFRWRRSGENFIGETKTEIEDAILLPMLGGVRKVFGIVDNDEPPVATD